MSTVKTGTAYTLFVLFLINFLNFFDRALPGVVLEPIRKEFGLSDTLLGLLGTAFIPEMNESAKRIFSAENVRSADEE